MLYIGVVLFCFVFYLAHHSRHNLITSWFKTILVVVESLAILRISDLNEVQKSANDFVV